MKRLQAEVIAWMCLTMVSAALVTYLLLALTGWV
jgi:hypothetical protein